MTSYSNQTLPEMLRDRDEVTFLLKDQRGDIVELVYIVYESYMEYRSDRGSLVPGPNALIFEMLGVEKFEFCSKHYGYPTCSGDWPECEWVDYAAMTRCVNALFSQVSGIVDTGKRRVFVNDSKARITVKDTLRTTQTQILQAFMGSETIPVNAFSKLPQGDVKDVLDSLVKLEVIKVEDGRFQRINASAIIYLFSRLKGQDVSVSYALESPVLARILKFLKDAPASVPTDSLSRQFPDADMSAALTLLKENGLIKIWEKGVYTRRESASQVERMIAKVS